MKNKTLFIVFTLIFLLGVLPTVSARDIIVGNGSGSSSTIQEAVGGAEAGDVIIIKPGTYIENINVSKARLTIKPETNNVFIEPADSSKPTIELSDFGTKLSGLNIAGSIQVNNVFYDGSKIFNEDSDMSQITNNVIGGIDVGSESSGIIISGNRISGGGIYVACCGDFNEIKNNVISNCPTGIYVYDERNVPPIRDNKISNCEVGIHVSGLSYDVINNEITNCGIGIQVYETGGATLVGNKITYCTDCGVEAGGYLGTSYNNYFNNMVNVRFGEYTDTDAVAWNTELTSGTNIIGGSHIGGNYWAKPDGTGFSQTAVDLNGDGIADSAYVIAENNIDYLPLIGKYNSVLPTSDFTANVTSGTAPLKVQFTSITTGNPTDYYWVFEPSNTGDWNSHHAVTAVHTFKNPGTYTITLTVGNAAGNNTIVKPNYITVTDPVITDPNLPIANFSTNVTEGYSPLSVQFSDFSENTTWRTWYFGDGASSNERNPVHVYTTEGSYNVYYSVSNENGTASKNARITVQKTGSSGGNSGGSSGGSSHKSGGGKSGGTGGSPEPQKNVEIKELSQAYVSSSGTTNFNFPKNATPVVYISFDSRKTFGKTTTIAEMLKGKSNLVSQLPESEVYKSLNIWVGNGGVANANNIENGVVCFRVGKAWIRDKKMDKDSITLNRYADKKWGQLSTTLLREDKDYIYFTAQTPEYGSFAITGKKISNQVENVPESNEETTKKVQSELETEIINQNNTGNKELQTEQKEKLDLPGLEISYGIAGLLLVFLFRRK
ncbi:MAG: PGF-pre-PGF domain-containing protein [Methanosarcina sp.]